MIGQVMAVWDDLFNVFLYGQGAFLGLIIMLSLMFLVTYKVKISAWIFVMVSIFLSVQYFDNVSNNQNFMWCGIIMLLNVFYLIAIGYKGVRSLRR